LGKFGSERVKNELNTAKKHHLLIKIPEPLTTMNTAEEKDLLGKKA